MDSSYVPGEIERKWQERWEATRLYQVKDDDPRPKRYELTMFPYPSGDLHIGHWYAMAPSDAHARYMRMRGFNVLHPMGFDAFGLPAENAAIKRGIHPYVWTMDNIQRMRGQLRSMGSMYDWSREVVACLPEYYKWTQWFFLKFYQSGLAYKAKAPVNWCPSCQTVLANEQVLPDGTCERCGTTATHKEMEQWFFRITRYAEELLNYDGLEWSERLRTIQTNWIGKSVGAEISFRLEREVSGVKDLKVFTTRPDTVFGVTFVVVAPEHPIVPHLTTPERQAEVAEYVSNTRQLTDIQRQSTEKEKTGVFTGSYVVNQLNGDRVPIWISDYVLVSYGTGVVMGVPAHDARDFEFAKKYGLEIKVVIAPPDWPGDELEAAYIGPGRMVNSGQFNGLDNEQGFEAICESMEKNGAGKRTISYRIRDWLVSRQRYWGAPIPIVYCEHCGIVPVPEEKLPVLLPPDAEFKPTGESPLKGVASFVSTTCPRCGHPAQRETDTMDTFMCSNWYYLRYTSPGYDKGPFAPEKVKKWMPVDLYTGGIEHAVLHLLYSRFFIKALRDMGLVEFGEPFIRMYNQGLIIRGKHKMSKSRGNVVAPDQYVSQFGADTVRAYLMFIGPWDQGGDWNDSGLAGVNRWLARVWNLVDSGYRSTTVDAASEARIRRATHKTIKRVTQDLDAFRFNTMIARLMELTNELGEVQRAGNISGGEWKSAVECLLLMMAPSAPHLAEELWEKQGGDYSVHNQRWPEWEEELTREDEITMVVQVNGKLRDRISVSQSVSEGEAREMALSSARVRQYVDGKQIRRVIYVPGKLINVVV
ncbi:MAG: leucine--tRNA ligase [Chloroflexi bacterium]|nr:leucine--tRNA ligase [Chloroflexota bacterium]